MQKILLNDAARTQLNGCHDEAELCDDNGQTIGYFVPKERHERLYGWAMKQVSDEELAEARQQSGGRPLREILAELEKR